MTGAEYNSAEEQSLLRSLIQYIPLITCWIALHGKSLRWHAIEGIYTIWVHWITTIRHPHRAVHVKFRYPRIPTDKRVVICRVKWNVVTIINIVRLNVFS